MKKVLNLALAFAIIMCIFVALPSCGSSYTVTFDSNGGTPIESAEAAYNAKLNKPTDPERPGYIFDGWYANDELWFFNYHSVTGNITLKAKWIPQYEYADNAGGDGVTLTKYIGNEENITIPGTIDGKRVTGISSIAFAGSGIKSVVIPEGITGIGDYAFWYCSDLTSVSIPDGLTHISTGAFAWCNSLTNITISDSVVSIGDQAFYLCNSLTSVYYTGTSDAWNLMNIGDAGNLTAATRYYFSETTPANTGNWWHYVDGVPTSW